MTEEVSPSKYEAFFGGCFRRGAFKYVLKLPDPGGEAARRGVRVHTKVEDYLQGKATVDADDLEWQMALALVQAAKVAPGTPEDLVRRGVTIEGSISFERNGVRYNGRKDLEVWSDYNRRRGLQIKDWKTTSNFDYALDTEGLGKNVQWLTYAAHSLDRHRDQDLIDGRWYYVLSKRYPPVREVPVTMTREQVEAGMVKVDDGARLIVAVREEGATYEDPGKLREWVNTLPHDETLTTCKKYGKEGCPFKSACAAHGAPMTSREVVRSAFRLKAPAKKEQTGMNIEELRAKMAAKKAEPAKPAAEQVAERKAQAEAEARAEEKKAESAAPKFTPPQGRTFAAPPPSPGHTGVTGGAKPATTLVDQLLDRAEEKAAAAPERETKAEVLPQDAELPKGNNSVPAGNTEKAPDQETKAKRAPRAAKAAPAGELAATASAPKRVLLVNAFSTKGGEVQNLSDFLKPVHAAIAEAHKVPHYMMIQYQGRAAFAEALEQYLSTVPAGTVLSLDARTGEGADALPTLERWADVVIRGA